MKKETDSHDKALHQVQTRFNTLIRWYSSLQLLVPDIPYSRHNFILIKMDNLKKEIENLIIDDYKIKK
jgi:hypothetical protein